MYGDVLCCPLSGIGHRLALHFIQPANPAQSALMPSTSGWTRQQAAKGCSPEAASGGNAELSKPSVVATRIWPIASNAKGTSVSPRLQGAHTECLQCLRYCASHLGMLVCQAPSNSPCQAVLTLEKGAD